MDRKYKVTAGGLLGVLVILALAWYLRHTTIAVLSPQGPIARQERDLIVTVFLLMLIVVIPVLVLTFWFAWRYRAGNTRAAYNPDFDHSRVIETMWWLIPSALIAVLSVITWNSTHRLDPFKPLAGAQPLTIQVVALDWKWLFIYPEQDIATVNFVQFPERTPVNFEITADAPMNSFWIPRLGGQIYAMPGMSTQLHLLASNSGSYRGSSANISGRGFAGMKFTAHSVSSAEFADWVQNVQRAPNDLNVAAYQRLSQPSENNPTAYYSGGKRNLYNLILSKYMVPGLQAVEPR